MKQPEMGKQVLRLRLQKGITQENLAEMCEVSTRTIQRIENGEVDPRSFTLNNLSTILEYDFRDENKNNDIFWIASLHLSSVFCIVILPLIIWSFGKHKNIEIDNHGKDVLNFQITMTILLLSATFLLIILFPGLIILMEQNRFISEGLFVLMAVLPVIFMICIGIICFYQGIKNTIQVIKGKTYKYFLSIPFIK